MLLLLLACNQDDTIPLHFDGPVAAAALPAEAGPFYDPVGFVANSRSGKITQLNLKEGRLLTDDPVASFLRAAPLTTGALRILTDVAVFTDGTRIRVWAADDGFTQLLHMPYITGLDANGAPIEVEPSATEVVFTDADGSGDAPTLSGLVLRAGFTTTEDWTVTFDGEQWQVEGSRSGPQAQVPVSGATYRSDDGEVEFVMEGDATAGDVFAFHTETGLVEIDLGGRVSALLASDGRLYASTATAPATLQVFDGMSGAWIGAYTFPDGAEPGRMGVADDGRIFVADQALAQVYTFHFEETSDPRTVRVETLATAAPLIDVAWQAGEDADGVPFEALFVAPVGLQRVDVYDLQNSTWIDPNPYTAAVEGIFVGPVSGLAPSVDTVWMQQPTTFGAYPRIPTVVVTTYDGRLFQLEAPTGCAVQNILGPQGPDPAYDSTDAYVTIEDQGTASNPSMWVDETTGRQIVTSGCGGVTRTEDWTVIYNSAALAWEVEGSISGPQVNLAREEERYVSDNGAVSFLIVPGSLPATDGDRFSFSVSDGLLVLNGSDIDYDGVVDVTWEAPGRPLTFNYTVGPTGGGWDPVDRREFVLVPAQNSDMLGRAWLETGETTVFWQ